MHTHMANLITATTDGLPRSCLLSDVNLELTPSVLLADDMCRCCSILCKLQGPHNITYLEMSIAGIELPLACGSMEQQHEKVL